MNVDIDITNVRLRTERLILRPWEPADVGDLFEYASVDGVGQMAGGAPHESLENSREILDMFINGKHVFALEYRGKAVGSLGIEKYNEKELPEFAGKRGAELGFVLSKDLWGKGLVVEAVREVVRYLFEELKLDFITCGYFEWNRQSGPQRSRNHTYPRASGVAPALGDPRKGGAFCLAGSILPVQHL